MGSNIAKFVPPFWHNQSDELFDSKLLEKFPSTAELKENHKNLYLRPLKSGDFDKGILEVLSQLTTVGNVSKLDFL